MSGWPDFLQVIDEAALVGCRSCLIRCGLEIRRSDTGQTVGAFPTISARDLAFVVVCLLLSRRGKRLSREHAQQPEQS